VNRVILFPDLIGKAFFDPVALNLLKTWRDGDLRPVTCRSLTLIYLRVLKNAGVNETNLRRWLWWFTSPEHSEYISDFKPEEGFSFKDQVEAFGERFGIPHILHLDPKFTGPLGHLKQDLVNEDCQWVHARDWLEMKFDTQ
jgi:hypothetical protein